MPRSKIVGSGINYMIRGSSNVGALERGINRGLIEVLNKFGYIYIVLLVKIKFEFIDF